MQFKSIIGQKQVIKRLLSSIHENRVAHTQLFLGPEGSGPLALAIAFAQYINCKNKSQEDSCGTCPSCVKYQKSSHPDLHFYFPTTSNHSVKKDPKSSLFLSQWREYLNEVGAYATQTGWYEHLGVGNKQGTIYVRDASELIKDISLKPYESEYKVFIIWMPEKLHASASNKLLKSFEEPPNKTLIILAAERYELLLPTVRSRAQLVKLNKLADADIAKGLENRFQLYPEQAADIALISEGNWNMAMEIHQNADETQENFIKFREWLRLCFRPGNYIELNKFNGELARMGREKMKRFLAYGLEVIHNSILHNTGHGHAVKKASGELDFSVKFAPFINSANQADIYRVFNEAIYHVERNAHAGILLTDLSFSLIDLLLLGRKQLAKN